MRSESNMSKKRGLGLWMSSALVVGNMIGSGIFLLPAALAAYGGISIIGWLFTATGAMLLALIYSRLSGFIPKTGGPYIYIRMAFGNFAGFIVAWGYWISIFIGNAAIAVGFVGYFAFFWPALASNSFLAGIVALASIWLLTWINTMGVRNAGFVQLVTTILKIVPLAVISTLGLLYFNIDNFTPFNMSGESSFSAITATGALTLWAFLGLESATIPAEDVKDPTRTIPRATVLGTLFSAVIYILGTVAVMGIIPPSALANSTAPFADAANSIWGSWAGYAVAAGAAISSFGALNGWILLSGQIPLAIARDNLFPAKFGRLSKRGTPVFGLVVSSVLVTVIMMMNYTKNLVEQFTFILLLSTLTALLLYAFSTMAELMISIKEREKFSKGRLLKTIVISVLAFLYTMWAIAGAGQEIVYWGFLLIMSGVPVYVWVQWRNA